jgi:CheY-like chemotaxis protein
MGGALTAASAGRDMGTTFTFTIPLLEDVSEAGLAAGGAARYLSSDDIGARSASTSAATIIANGSSAASLASLEEQQAQQAPRAHAQPPAPFVMTTSAAGGMAADGGQQQRALRVMVAEDDRLCASLMHKILLRLQVDGTVVGDGAAAVAMYEQHGAAACPHTCTHLDGLARQSMCVLTLCLHRLLVHLQRTLRRLTSSSWTCSASQRVRALRCTTVRVPSHAHTHVSARAVCPCWMAWARPFRLRSWRAPPGAALRPLWCAAERHLACVGCCDASSAYTLTLLATQALTASCSEEQKQRCAAAGMVAHLSKPVKLDTLQALLHKYAAAAAPPERPPPPPPSPQPQQVTRVSAWG